MNDTNVFVIHVNAMFYLQRLTIISFSYISILYFFLLFLVFSFLFFVQLHITIVDLIMNILKKPVQWAILNEN